MKLSRAVAACSFLLLPLGEESSSAFAENFKLKKSEVSVVDQNGSKTTCGLHKAWLPVKKLSGGYYTVDTKASKAKKTSCKKILRTGTLKSLSAIPSAGDIIGESARVRQSRPYTTTFTGAPPTLVEISQQSTKNLFWRPGVVDRIIADTASESDCNEFFSGTADGESGGFGACMMTQSVGQSLENILRSGTSLCYMKKAPTPEHVADGSFSLVTGDFPEDDVQKLFVPPTSGAARIVKINVTGHADQAPQDEDGSPATIFIKVYPAPQNASAGFQYHADLYFCEPGDTNAGESESIKVKLNGEYVSENQASREGGEHYSSSVTSFLTTVNGEVVIDHSRNREASNAFIQDEDSQFKSKILLDGNNVVHTKSMESFLGLSTRGASAIHVSGASIESLRFLEGAFRGTLGGDLGLDYTSLAEFRDAYYATALSSPFGNEVAHANLDTDPFFTTSTPIAPVAFNCRTNPNITVALDFTNPAFSNTAAECEGERLDGMDFCNNDPDVQAAQENLLFACGFSE